MTALRVAIVCLFWGLNGGVQLTSQDPLNRDSPQSSVTAFLAACHAGEFQRAWRYIDLRKLPADRRLNDGTQLARQLQQILDRDAQFDVGALSRNPEGSPAGTNQERIDSFSVDGKNTRIATGARDPAFRSQGLAGFFRQRRLIPRIARLASDSPIEKYLPDPLVSWKLMDTPVWHWMALLLLAAALALLSMLFARLALLWMEPALKRIAPMSWWDRYGSS